MFFKRDKDFRKKQPLLRITESSASPSSKAMVRTVESLECFIKDLVDILNIDFPDFRIVGFLYQILDQTAFQYEFRAHELSPYNLTTSMAGFTPDDSNTVHLAEYTTIPGKTSLSLQIVQLSSAETLFTIAHELRHIWQRHHHNDLYTKSHAFGMEAIDNIFEIDADAFATAYVFSSKTPFSPIDFPNVMELICLQGAVDNGKRWSLSHELSKQYSFGDIAKIDAAKASFPIEL